MAHMRRLHTSMCIVSSLALLTGEMIRSWTAEEQTNTVQLPVRSSDQLQLFFFLDVFLIDFCNFA
jgi:hypothetical protein